MCSLVNGNTVEYKNKCKTELPPLIDSDDFTNTNVDTKKAWRRCWRDYYEQ